MSDDDSQRSILECSAFPYFHETSVRIYQVIGSHISFFAATVVVAMDSPVQYKRTCVVSWFRGHSRSLPCIAVLPTSLEWKSNGGGRDCRWSIDENAHHNLTF